MRIAKEENQECLLDRNYKDVEMIERVMKNRMTMAMMMIVVVMTMTMMMERNDLNDSSDK